MLTDEAAAPDEDEASPDGRTEFLDIGADESGLEASEMLDAITT